MATIEERWNELPIPERVDIAVDAGLTGRIGSAAWEDLSDGDREALESWASPTELVPDALDTPDDDRAAQDYLMWIGYSNYPTIRSFIEEAERLGVSKRISRRPLGLELGVSRVFLAHDEGETGDAVIIGYVVPETIEVIVHRDDNGIPPELVGLARGVPVESAVLEDMRGCGLRDDIGSIYLVGTLTMIRPYKDYNLIIDPRARRFRGIKRVSGAAILSGRSKKAPSVTHRVARSERMDNRRGRDWTTDERNMLRNLAERFGPWRGAREMHKISGRSVNGCLYQLIRIRKEVRDEPI